MSKTFGNLANRNLRRSLLRKSRFRCKDCGRRVVEYGVVQKFREIVSREFNCVSWKSEVGVFKVCIATLEHIVPVSHGGTTDPENCEVLCDECNNNRNRKFEKARFYKLLNSGWTNDPTNLVGN